MISKERASVINLNNEGAHSVISKIYAGFLVKLSSMSVLVSWRVLKFTPLLSSQINGVEAESLKAVPWTAFTNLFICFLSTQHPTWPLALKVLISELPQIFCFFL